MGMSARATSPLVVNFEEQTDGVRSPTEESNELSEGGLGTPPTSPRITRVEQS
jgi:hypothetical protein